MALALGAGGAPAVALALGPGGGAALALALALGARGAPLFTAGPGPGVTGLFAAAPGTGVKRMVAASSEGLDTRNQGTSAEPPRGCPKPATPAARAAERTVEMLWRNCRR